MAISPGIVKWRFSRGMALALVMLTLAVCAVLGALFVVTASTTAQVAHGSEQRLRARMIAESGLAVARIYLADDANWRTNRPNGTWVTTHAFAGGTFTLQGEDGSQVNDAGQVVGDGSLSDDPLDPVTITAVGAYGTHKYLVRTTLTPSASSKLAVSERVTVRESGVVDSYSSSAGAYGGANVGQAAVVSSNAVAQPNVRLSNTARVNGNLYVGPGGNPSWCVVLLNSSTVTGTKTTLPAAVAFTTPSVPSMGASAGDVSYASGTTMLSSDLHCTNLTLSGTGKLVTQGNRTIVVDGDFTVADAGTLEVGAAATYAAAVTGTVQLLDSAMVDSYNSSLGAYGGTNVGSSARVATTSTGSARISVSGGTIKGNAYSGAGSNPNTAITGSVTGTKSALASNFSVPAPPAWPSDVGSNTGTYDKSSGIHTIGANLQVDSFKITSTATVRISGHRAVRVNKEFVVDNTAKLEILANSSLKVYVQEYFKFSADAQVNHNTKDPSLLTIYSKGSGYEHTILNNAQAHAIVDSPNSTLTISDSADLYGVFMGQSLLLKVGAAFHHDLNSAIAAASSRLATAPVTDTLTVYTKGAFSVSGTGRMNANTSDAAKLTINHVGDSPVNIKGTSLTYASVVAPDATWQVGEQATYYGKARARDINVSGTSATVHATASGGTSDPGLLAKETIDLSGGAVLNGVGGSAIIASNAKNTLAISLEDAAVLKGSASSGPGGSAADIYKAATATLTGATGMLGQAVTIANPAFPAVSSPPDRIYSGSTTTVLTGSVQANDFRASSNAVIEMDGAVTLSVAGAFVLADGAKIKLRSGASLTLYCHSTASISGSATVNDDSDPAKLLMYVNGSSVSLAGTSKVFSKVVAPLAQLKVSDSAQLFGSYEGKTLKVMSSGKVHFDVAASPRVAWIEQR